MGNIKTIEEQRFTAAVAAMQAIIQKGPIHRLYADMPTLISESVEHTIEEAVLYADALMKELDNKVDYKEIPERPYVEDLLDSHIKKKEPLPPYEKDLFANSKNGDGKKTTPDPITEPSMNAIGDIKLRK